MILELGIIAQIAAANSPWSSKLQYQQPYMTITQQITNEAFFEFYQSARVNIRSVNFWNPQTALYKFEAGYQLQKFTFAVGHQSEHEIGKKDTLTESYDYLRIKYRTELF